MLNIFNINKNIIGINRSNLNDVNLSNDITTNDEMLNSLRKAANIHRSVRKYAQSLLEPNINILDFCNKLENKTKELSDPNELNNGIGFPTGVSINNCAAHYTPYLNDNIILKSDDVLKVDFGVHVNGRIIDSAFTISFDPKYNDLLKAVQDATNTGIKEAGIGVRLGELGEKIQETMESYEIELNGKNYAIKSVRNLGGHSIGQYKIHSGKLIPCVKTDDQTKMEENEIYAIETFGTTGSGIVFEKEPTSHYMIENMQFKNLKLKSSRKLLSFIKKKFGTLPFSNKWLDAENSSYNYNFALKNLCENNIVKKYPPLYDIDKSYIAQYEHTILLRENNKEILSKGNDY